MKILLWDAENVEWKLYENPTEEELKKRSITIHPQASIGDGASIGNRASIGYGASIGNRASIVKAKDVFSWENIFLRLGLLPDNDGYITVYKTTNPDGSSFHSSEFVYKEGMSWKESLKRDQDVNCGPGCHFSNVANAISFASDKGAYLLVSAKVKLDDILSVHDKIRVKAFKDVQFIKLECLITKK